MRIQHAKVFVGRAFVEADIEFDSRITAIGKLEGDADMDAAGRYVVPGFVDIHTHGAVGEDFSDGKPEGLLRLSAYYAVQGVTSFLATTMTLKENALLPAMRAVRGFADAGGAKCAGVHLEGPFLSYAKRARRRRRTCICRTRRCSAGSTRPAAAESDWLRWRRRRMARSRLSGRYPPAARYPSDTPRPITIWLWPPFRQLSQIGRSSLSFELPLGFKEAEAYRKANGQYLRKNQWRDTTARVLIDLD